MATSVRGATRRMSSRRTLSTSYGAASARAVAARTAVNVRAVRRSRRMRAGTLPPGAEGAGGELELPAEAERDVRLRARQRRLQVLGGPVGGRALGARRERQERAGAVGPRDRDPRRRARARLGQGQLPGAARALDAVLRR